MDNIGGGGGIPAAPGQPVGQCCDGHEQQPHRGAGLQDDQSSRGQVRREGEGFDGEAHTPYADPLVCGNKPMAEAQHQADKKVGRDCQQGGDQDHFPVDGGDAVCSNPGNS